MAEKKGDLQFNYDKYENYEDDFHRQEMEDPDQRRDFNMQTSGVQSPKKKTQGQDEYEADFHNSSVKKNSPKIVNTASRQKMIEQNIKLKTQIYELAKQMDEILAKEKKHKKYGIHADEEEDEAIKQKKV